MLIVLIADLALALSGTSVAPTNHLDGAFQTFSGLNRLLQGDVVAKDFIPYLGPGPLFFVFVPFLVFGGHLVASVISAKLLTLVIFQGIIYFIFKQYNRSPKTTAPMVATLAFTVLLFGLYNPDLIQLPQVQLAQDFYETVLSASQPGFSLRPIRASAPYIFIAILFLLQRFSTETRQAYYALIALGVVTALWSNDYAIPTALVFATQLIYPSVLKKRFTLSLRLILTLMISWWIAVSLFTGGHPIEMIKYNLIDVPNTQFWYFGPWLGNSRILSPLDFAQTLTDENVWFSLAVLFSTTIMFISSKQTAVLPLVTTGLVTFLGGLVATVGGHAGGYFWAFKFWSYVSICAVIFLYASKVISRVKIKKNLTTVLTGFAMTIVFSFSLLVFIKDKDETRALAESYEYFYSTNVGGYLPLDFSNLRPSNEQGDVIEEYFGIASTLGRYEAGGTRVDSVIHALGSERAKYEKILRSYEGDFITTSPSMDVAWTSWNFSANWWFYKNLITKFSPIETSPNTITWKFEPDTKLKINKASVDCKIDKDKQKIVFSSKVSGLHELRLEQDPKFQVGRAFAMIENNINLSNDANAFLAISPNEEVVTLPFFADESTQLSIKMVGDFNFATLRSCSLSQVTLSPSQGEIYKQLFGLSLTPVSLTDSNWTRGFNNGRAGFFVPRKRENVDLYKNVERVEFEDGDSRIVTRIEMIDSYINIWLEGAPFAKTQGKANLKLVLKDGSVVE